MLIFKTFNVGYSEIINVLFDKDKSIQLISLCIQLVKMLFEGVYIEIFVI